MNLAALIEVACILEARAPKAGNVHPGVSFVDLSYADFVHASRVIAEPIASANATGVGRAILNAVDATRKSTGTNVNLGIVLLMAPLAAVPLEQTLSEGIGMILDGTTTEDAELAYAAIRIASPGGLGKASAQDTADRPTISLKAAMCLAAERDQIAEQYSNRFQQVFESRHQLCDFYERTRDWNAAIVTLQVWMLSQWRDTLIARKCGVETADEARHRARQLIDGLLARGTIDSSSLGEFDRWLRSDGHRRNPGTTADLIAAALFSAFRDGLLVPPQPHEITT